MQKQSFKPFLFRTVKIETELKRRNPQEDKGESSLTKDEGVRGSNEEPTEG